MYTVGLRNLKGIKELIFEIPIQRGFYLLTGANGCGKTTLLVALNRMRDNLSFAKYLKKNCFNTTIDSYQGASIVYTVEGESVTYKRTGIRWVPAPKTNSKLLGTIPFKNILFMTAAENRFYVQKDEEPNQRKIECRDVADAIIKPMNEILSTKRFTKLKYLTVKKLSGKRKKPCRDNKLYIVEGKNGKAYSESNFSLGERLLLNTLDFIENIKENSLLLIDEVELALHPVAQIKFYDYLKDKAREQNLVIIISTHSSSLIKHADKHFFLDNIGGKVYVLTDCYPAFILKDLVTEEDNRPDYIFFVEDVMAERYLRQLLRIYQKKEDKHLVIKIVPVGGWRETVKLMKHFASVPPFSINVLQAFLDADVKDCYDELKMKTDLSDAEHEDLSLLKDTGENISYLEITPELGCWNWLEDVGLFCLEAGLKEDFGELSFSIHDVVKNIIEEESGNKTGNLRKYAKGCFKNLSEKFCMKIPVLKEHQFFEILFKCYTEDRMRDIEFFNKMKGEFKKIIHRK